MVMLWVCVYVFFFFQAEDGIRDLVRSRGLVDVYKRQDANFGAFFAQHQIATAMQKAWGDVIDAFVDQRSGCLLYTSDAADERSSVDLGGRRIIKKTTRAE